MGQMAKMLHYLQNRHRAFPDENVFYLNSDARDAKNKVKALFECNRKDLWRCLNLDSSLLLEKPVFFLKDLREKCGQSCETAKGGSCYCNGLCFKDQPCHWLRFYGGMRYCWLVHPWFPERKKLFETGNIYMDMKKAALEAPADCRETVMGNFAGKKRRETVPGYEEIINVFFPDCN